MFAHGRKLLAGIAAAHCVSLSPAASQDVREPASDITLPGLSGFAAPRNDGSLAISSDVEVTLAAQMTGEAGDITRGLVWRIFGNEPGADGKLPLLHSGQGGTQTFQLAPGSYLVHAAFGRAGATKKIVVESANKRENLVIDAGGLQLDAVLANGRSLPAAKLSFDIYEANGDDHGAMIVRDAKPNTVVRLNAGVYQVESRYGNVNAVIRSSIRVEAGKLIQATVEHHAAEVTFKLVREQGGEAMADTSWSIVTDSGDPIRETVGAYATMVLAEGNYTVIAKNRDRIYQREYTVEGGVDQEVEVLTTEVQPLPESTATTD